MTCCLFMAEGWLASATSLTNVMPEIKRDASYSFGGSNTSQLQIERGAPHAQPMERHVGQPLGQRWVDAEAAVRGVGLETEDRLEEMESRAHKTDAASLSTSVSFIIANKGLENVHIKHLADVLREFLQHHAREISN